MNTQKKEKGFTIIEVVLVLAIAGLIFLMVFIALPALSRNQRDTQRKNDLSRAQTAITSFSSNNRGAIPTDWDGTFKTAYLTAGTESFVDPSGANSANSSFTSYSFTLLAADKTTPAFSTADSQNVIYYTVATTCGDDGAVVTAGSRKVSLRMALEGGGSACVNN